MIYDFLKRLKAGTEDETNGRHVLPDQVRNLVDARSRILDIGAGYGRDIKAVEDKLRLDGKQTELFAIESFPAAVSHLAAHGVKVHDIDIERDKLPFENAYFDVVMCNQVLEHTKEIFWVIAEICRVLKPDGHLVLGVPNLGSLHNRLALAAGLQPPAIHVFGPHVRGFTAQGLRAFLEKGGQLKVERVLGGNFYPFPPAISRPLSRMFPGLSVSSFYIVRRVGSGDFLDIFNTDSAKALVDTPYFRGVAL